MCSWASAPFAPEAALARRAAAHGADWDRHAVRPHMRLAPERAAERKKARAEQIARAAADCEREADEAATRPPAAPPPPIVPEPAAAPETAASPEPAAPAPEPVEAEPAHAPEPAAEPEPTHTPELAAAQAPVAATLEPASEAAPEPAPVVAVEPAPARAAAEQPVMLAGYEITVPEFCARPANFWNDDFSALRREKDTKAMNDRTYKFHNFGGNITVPIVTFDGPLSSWPNVEKEATLKLAHVDATRTIFEFVRAHYVVKTRKGRGEGQYVQVLSGNSSEANRHGKLIVVCKDTRTAVPNGWRGIVMLPVDSPAIPAGASPPHPLTSEILCVNIQAIEEETKLNCAAFHFSGGTDNEKLSQLTSWETAPERTVEINAFLNRLIFDDNNCFDLFKSGDTKKKLIGADAAAAVKAAASAAAAAAAKPVDVDGDDDEDDEDDEDDGAAPDGLAEPKPKRPRGSSSSSGGKLKARSSSAAASSARLRLGSASSRGGRRSRAASPFSWPDSGLDVPLWESFGDANLNSLSSGRAPTALPAPTGAVSMRELEVATTAASASARLEVFQATQNQLNQAAHAAGAHEMQHRMQAQVAAAQAQAAQTQIQMMQQQMEFQTQMFNQQMQQQAASQTQLSSLAQYAMRMQVLSGVAGSMQGQQQGQMNQLLSQPHVMAMPDPAPPPQLLPMPSAAPALAPAPALPPPANPAPGAPPALPAPAPPSAVPGASALPQDPMYQPN